MEYNFKDSNTEFSFLTILFLQDFCEHGSKSGLSQGAISTLQNSDILSLAKEQPQAKAGSGQNSCGVEDVLQLLRILYIVASDPYTARTSQEGNLVILQSF